MTSILYKRASSLDELNQIKKLQLQNSPQCIDAQTKMQEGFVTVQHSVALLEQMNFACAHIVAKYNDYVIGYALVMLSRFRNEIVVLIPMFKRIDTLVPKHQSYIVMGQICIAENYRKQGIFRGLYQFYKSELGHQYDFLITEVDVTNFRSLRAHQAVGFTIIDSYEENGIFWNIMSWDWT